MKRLHKIDNNLKLLIELYKSLRKFDKFASKKDNFNVHRYILSYIIRFSAKMDEYPDLSFFVDDMLSYQEQGGNKEKHIFKFTDKNFNLDIVKKYLPKSIINTIAYRTILLDKKNLDKNNLEQSIRNNIYKNDIESWTLDKNYADNLEKSLLQEFYNKSKVPIRMTTKVEGINLPIFWSTLKEKYFNSEEEFDERFFGIDEDYTHENEILAIAPDDYEIYNLDEIKELL